MHEVRVTAPADQPGVDGGAAIGVATHPSPPGPPPLTIRRGTLPQDVPVSAWHRDREGVITRADAELLTPLPWWQRFPFDLATDFAPTDLVVRRDYTLAESPVAAHSREQLDAEAAAAGYATLDAPTRQTPP